MTIVVAFIAACVIGFGSIYFFGPNNAVEEDAKEVAEDILEVEFHIPQEEIDQIDAGLAKLEKGKAKPKADNS